MLDLNILKKIHKWGIVKRVPMIVQIDTESVLKVSKGTFIINPRMIIPAKEYILDIINIWDKLK